MKILIAPDSFKGTYTAMEVAGAIAGGVSEAQAEPLLIPVADGGEGTFDVLSHTLGAKAIPVKARNPWGADIDAFIGLSESGKAVVELAQASGLTVPHAGYRDPLTADTYGTGMMIVEAVRRGAGEILVAAGGSATTDGGAGAVRAIQEAGGLSGSRVIILSDVVTPFLDAARVFGPQKGADAACVEILTNRLQKQAREFPRDPSSEPRTGAAGGFSGGLWAHFGAELVSGADYVLDTLGFDDSLSCADAVIVGEGRLDSQTGEGKILSAILTRVQRSIRNIPVFAVVGSVSTDLGDYGHNFADVIIATDFVGMRHAGAAVVAHPGS
ncbi:glycerate kinase [Crystallibacter degradans]|uniref:glycerate kinase n=1 Tax=Crystallibacter degradans TaxID=2726743 RepID=UPI00147468BE|nr:glycerate kinase [Arthrobacter sp. SF27]NMR32239.1 glycerate kinase [Arthrobacter sp. SF27]